MKERAKRKRRRRDFKKVIQESITLPSGTAGEGEGEIYDPRYLWCFLSPPPNVGIAESPGVQRTPDTLRGKL